MSGPSVQPGPDPRPDHTPVLTFFNNKGGVGKTSLVYHLAWMFADHGVRVVVADLDPQANLTAAFLDEDRIAALLGMDEEQAGQPKEAGTILACIRPLFETGDIANPDLSRIAPNLFLIPGSVGLSAYEEDISREWPNALGERSLFRPMKILSAFWQVVQMAASETRADIVLVDIGPSLGAINRSALISTDHVVIPLGADLFSLQGLANLGPQLVEWREGWSERLGKWEKHKGFSRHSGLRFPSAQMEPVGYLCQQHSVRLDRPVRAYDKWVNRIPGEYRKSILNEKDGALTGMTPQDDPHCLAMVKHYRSLIPMAQEHRKPVFHLTPADGAIGSHAQAAQAAGDDFKMLARKIAGKIKVQFPKRPPEENPLGPMGQNL